MRTQVVEKHEIVVRRDHLAELEAKAKAHDAYMAACQKMGARATEIRATHPRDAFEQGNRAGWLDCLHTFNRAVVDAPPQEVKPMAR